jgi:hypothetical protein
VIGDRRRVDRDEDQGELLLPCESERGAAGIGLRPPAVHERDRAAAGSGGAKREGDPDRDRGGASRPDPAERPSGVRPRRRSEPHPGDRGGVCTGGKVRTDETVRGDEPVVAVERRRGRDRGHHRVRLDREASVSANPRQGLLEPPTE